MSTATNPFLLNGYDGPELFCDRKTETKDLIRNVTNGVNTTLTSLRRMGKTGLLLHTIETMRKQKTAHCIYLDVYSLQNLKEFASTFATGVLNAFPEKKPIGKQILEWIKALRPIISFDPITGNPEVQLDFVQPQQYESTLLGLFKLLEQQNTRIAVIIDEFQQVSNFTESNMESRLRSIIQPLKKTRFIFSGSDQHLLAEMFNNSKRPFFASTQLMHLKEIERVAYADFIAAKFESGKRKINADAIEFILDFTRLHTYYTQALCNRVFSSNIKVINESVAKTIAAQFLKEQEPVYFQYRSLLTATQWNLLKAIAIEDTVYKPTSFSFINTHNLDSASNVQRSMEALLMKEMIYKGNDENGSYYRVYDCFLSRWLGKT